MHLMVVIGAGASFDSWPKHVARPHDYESVRLPLANNLFAPLPTQNSFLDSYRLMGLASILRSKAGLAGFDIEAELARISDTALQRNDTNTIQSLFKTRFYLHGVITALTQRTLRHTSSHTLYVDLIVKLKEWIDESPTTRYVDIVVFNYDNLIEKAMENVYGYDWHSKNSEVPLRAYYRGNNLKIYKPHGSINWGREILKGKNHYFYNGVDEAFQDFDQLELASSFQFIDPNTIANADQSKNVIPAIAVPFKKKTNFDECPQEMQTEMLTAVNNANKVITIGWKGADEHFTKLLSTNSKVDEVCIVSPRADTQLDEIFPVEKIRKFESPASYFISETPALEGILSGFDKS